MGVCYFEKIALDDTDRRFVGQMRGLWDWMRDSKSAVGMLGRGLRGIGRAAVGVGRAGVRGLQFAGDMLVNHPTRTLIGAAGVGVAAHELPGRIGRAINNVSPENVYRY